ncbi:hypothetical protein Tco_1226028 [Tanacetum coccineum]
MANLKFTDTHNMVAFLSKPEESDGFEQIVDFLNAHPIKYALTVNPTIYISCIEQFWSTVKAKIINGEVQLHALVDGKKVIFTEVTVRRDLQLEDEEGVDCLPNSTIFEQLTLMGSKTTARNAFSSTMAFAIICLTTNQKFNFSKYIFESMVRNLDNLSGKFLMYPRFVSNYAGQNQMGKGSAMPNDPQHTPTFIQSSPPPQKTQKPNEAVHKELGDSLVRAATIASSLEAEHDSGNIAKTRSKATPNKSSSLGTTLGGGPSNEDRLKLNELMELYTNLQKKVLDLEKTKTTQANEIPSLKRRVKKLEKKRSSRTHKLKRLYKVGLTARVESFGDEEDLGEDASKQGRRINDIDENEDITLVNVQDDADNEMFDVATMTGDEVFAEQEVAAKDVNLTVDEVTLAQALAALKSVKSKVKGDVIEEPSVPVSAASASTKDKGKKKMIKPEKPLKKKDLIRLDEEIASKLQAEFDKEERLAREKDEANVALTEEWDDIQAKIEADHELKHFAAKRAEDQRNKPPTQAQQRKIMCTYLKNMEGKKLKDLKNKSFDSIQKMFDRAFKRVNTFVDFRTYLVEDTAELQSLMEVIPDEEEVAIDVVPLATKSPSIIDWKIHKEGKKSYYQIVKADGKSQMYKNDLHAGRKEISPYTTYNYRYAEQDASEEVMIDEEKGLKRRYALQVYKLKLEKRTCKSREVGKDDETKEGTVDAGSDCPELKNRNHGNQAEGTEARGMVYALEGGDTDQDLNNIEDEIEA